MRNLLWITALFIIIISCGKDGNYMPVLPAATSSGQNTMGFIYSDSVVWTGLEVVPTRNNKLNETSTFQFRVQTNSDSTKSFYLDGKMYVKQTDETVTANSEMSIQIGNADFTTRTYTFDSSSHASAVTFKNKMPAGVYYNMPHSFSLTVTYVDVNKHIISGIFSGKLFTYNAGAFNLTDTVPIQNGRFDAVYTQ